MSTLYYASLTTNREQPPAGALSTASASGVGRYVDALAALVPAEVLALHAAVIAVTTQTTHATTTITATGTLAAAFYALVVLAAGLYVVPRLLTRKWNLTDYFRAAIPPLAFVGWTMLQRATAFDAAFPAMNSASRTVAAMFLAAILGWAATVLAYKPNQKTPVGV